MRRFLLAINPLRWIEWGAYWLGYGSTMLLAGILGLVIAFALFTLSIAGGMQAGAFFTDVIPGSGLVNVIVIILAMVVGLAAAAVIGIAIMGLYGGALDAIAKLMKVNDLYSEDGTPHQGIDGPNTLSHIWPGVPSKKARHGDSPDRNVGSA